MLLFVKKITMQMNYGGEYQNARELRLSERCLKTDFFFGIWLCAVW